MAARAILEMVTSQLLSVAPMTLHDPLGREAAGFGSEGILRMAMITPDPNSLSDLQKAARQLLNDVEAMAAGTEFEFGGFSEWISAGEEGVLISWPNLAISAAKLREALERSRS